VVFLGLVMLALAALVNGATVRLFHGARALDFVDVFRISSRWSLALGLATVVLGVLVLRSPARWLARLALAWSLLALFVVGDRLLLAGLGLPLWVHDPEAHYRQRPGAVRLAAGRTGKLVRIDSWGFHDEEFPLAKPPGELRGVVVGDSVTMGHMLTFEETFCEQLEALLDERDRLHATHQIINAGVQGYAVFQELLAFEDALRFAPDFVALGFCMNDVTEPLVVQRKFGGTGVDYHAVREDRSPVLGMLRNETGVGRLLVYLEQRGVSAEKRKLWEDSSVRGMVEELALAGEATLLPGEAALPTTGAALPAPDSRYRAIWERTLADLDRVRALAAEHEIPFFLLVFPYTFQIYDPTLRGPQRILAEHAARSGIVLVDFVEPFRRVLVPDETALELELAAANGPDAVLRAHAAEWSRYYLDTNHLAPEGHRLVAEELFDVLVREGLAAQAPGR
jgi:hypothetical protein